VTTIKGILFSMARVMMDPVASLGCNATMAMQLGNRLSSEHIVQMGSTAGS
jgi:hypothetical protein